MLAVTGYNSRIVQELIPLLPQGEEVVRIDGEPPVCDRYLLCAGSLRPKTLLQHDPSEIEESLRVNLIRPMQLCDSILDANDKARICVVGSESGFSWSYDGVYAASKAALHRYVETKKLRPDQQLVCVAPSVVEDCGMTLRRQDVENLERRRAEHPKRRFIRAVEISRLIHFLLYVDEGYISGQVIRVNGGL
jgi:NAD(P)-dependent dehydrogenase (short-subunit alcohol dehydrogenase family)